MNAFESNALQSKKLTLSQKIEQAMENAIQHLTNVLEYEEYTAETHEVVLVKGWNDSDETRQSISNYLVGLRACAIDAALNIYAALYSIDSRESRFDLYKSVCEIVGDDSNTLSTSQKEDERNPWISEGIWNLCMVIASRRPEIHPSGNVIGLNYVHVKAKDHGLDGLVMYQNQDSLGLSIIESKAYKLDPNKAINKAVAFFKEIDEDRHSTRIKQEVQIIRTALPKSFQDKVTTLFWKNNRTYIPNPHYDSQVQIDWRNKRTSFNDLQVCKKNRIIMPHIVDDFDDFFNDISDRMRVSARGFLDV